MSVPPAGVDLRHVAAVAFYGTIWSVNVVLGFGLLAAPRRVVAFLTNSATRHMDWLRVLGVLILANTAFAVLALVIARMYYRTLAEFLGMPA